jgi:hypothetical protein
MGNRPSSSHHANAPHTSPSSPPRSATAASATTHVPPPSRSSMTASSVRPPIPRLPSLERAPSGGARLTKQSSWSSLTTQAAGGADERVILDGGLGRPQYDDGGGLSASFINPCGIYLYFDTACWC